jgi:hypothetical protein
MHVLDTDTLTHLLCGHHPSQSGHAGHAELEGLPSGAGVADRELGVAHLVDR